MKTKLILPRLTLKEHLSILIIPENVANYSLICFFATFHYLNEVHMDIQISIEQEIQILHSKSIQNSEFESHSTFDVRTNRPLDL